MMHYDIVIVGAGPAGLLLSLCLSRWGYRVKHIDNRPVPTATGRADGIQPRSTEILRNLGLKRALMAYEPARVYDVAFWDPKPGGGIHRTGNWPSCPRFIDTRYPFTMLLHQGKIERVFLDEIARAGTTVERPWTIIGFRTDGGDEEYPVEVELKCLDTNVVEKVRTKYLFSAEGSKSSIRQQLGIALQYKDPISFVWGVMDGVVRTDFPDIRVRCTSLCLPLGRVSYDCVDKMYHPLREWLYNGYSARGQYGPPLCAACLINGPRLEPPQDCYRGGSTSCSEANTATIHHRMGSRRVGFCVSNRTGNCREVHP